MAKTVSCPNCRKPVAWTAESRWRPFCSERCRLIDLGEWFEERQRISEPLEEGYGRPGGEDEDGHH